MHIEHPVVSSKLLVWQGYVYLTVDKRNKISEKIFILFLGSSQYFVNLTGQECHLILLTKMLHNPVECQAKCHKDLEHIS